MTLHSKRPPTTWDLTNIIVFLKNRNKAVCMKEISNGTGVPHEKIKPALAWLIAYGLVNESKGRIVIRKTNRKGYDYAVKVYGLNEKIKHIDTLAWRE